VRLGLTRLPAGVTWLVLVGAGCLGGIGFTMSLFMGGLGLEDHLRDQAKIAILAGSTLSGLLGCLLLLAFLPRRDDNEKTAHELPEAPEVLGTPPESEAPSAVLPQGQRL